MVGSELERTGDRILPFHRGDPDGRMDGAKSDGRRTDRIGRSLLKGNAVIKKASTHLNQNEGAIFERSRPGKIGYHLPALDVEAEPLDSLLDARLRRNDGLAGLPEVSEVDVIRHFTRISTWNYAVDYGMYPLGSCTMKYNPKLNERVARLEGFAASHPYTPDELAQGNLELLKQLEDALAEITGLAAVSLQPAAGA